MDVKYIIFYNHNHSGDINASRSFVRAILQKFPDAVPCYFHNNSKRLTLDLCPSTHRPEFFDKNAGFYYKDNTLYVNTWYVANNGKYFKDCTIQTLHTLFQSELRSLGLDIISDNILDYLPSYDWKFYQTERIKEYFKGQKIPHVLVCNNMVQSGQAVNFDMIPYVIELAKLFPNIKFILTNPNLNSKQYAQLNIINSEDIIGFPSNNWPETGYLSTFCPIIIGRSSGGYSFSLLKENILENPKKFVGICTPETYNFGLTALLEKDIFTQLDYNDSLLNKLSQLIDNTGK